MHLHELALEPAQYGLMVMESWFVIEVVVSP